VASWSLHTVVSDACSTTTKGQVPQPLYIDLQPVDADLLLGRNALPSLDHHLLPVCRVAVAHSSGRASWRCTGTLSRKRGHCADRRPGARKVGTQPLQLALRCLMGSPLRGQLCLQPCLSQPGLT
jgi:hypothetical protein